MSKIRVFDDERGTLIPIEFDSLGFEIKRVFIVNNVPIGSIRGNHAHYTTKQYIICVKGGVDVVLHDGKNEVKYSLNKGDTVLVPELVWDSQIFNTEDAEILVLCSNNYNIDDYILDFSLFKSIVNVDYVR